MDEKFHAGRNEPGNSVSPLSWRRVSGDGENEHNRVVEFLYCRYNASQTFFFSLCVGARLLEIPVERLDIYD